MESVLGALETELLNGQPEVNKIAALRWDDDGSDDDDGDDGEDDDGVKTWFDDSLWPKSTAA